MSIPSNPPIKKESWSCSICLEIMDGTEEHNGKACISKRCMHIFHESCVERSIDAKRSCPLCRTHLDRVSLMHNTDFEQECIEWQKDPYGYTLEAAFFRKYSCYPQDLGVRAEDVLRPRELHGQNWNPELTDKEKLKFVEECIEHGYSSKEFFSTLADSYQEIHRMHEESRQEFSVFMQRSEEESLQYRERERIYNLRGKGLFSFFYKYYNFPRNPQRYEDIYWADKQVLRAVFLISIFALQQKEAFDRETNVKGIFLSIVVNELGVSCIKSVFRRYQPLASIQHDATQNQKVTLKIVKIVSGTIIGSGISCISGSWLPKVLLSKSAIKKIAFIQSGFKLLHSLFSERRERD